MKKEKVKHLTRKQNSLVIGVAAVIFDNYPATYQFLDFFFFSHFF